MLKGMRLMALAKEIKLQRNHGHGLQGIGFGYECGSFDVISKLSRD